MKSKVCWLLVYLIGKHNFFVISPTKDHKKNVSYLCVFSISSTIQGRIDQVNQVLELNQQHQGSARYNALDNWTYQLSSLHLAIANKMA